MTTLSVWCTHPPGITRHSASQHRVCEQRQKKGLLPPCSCEHHGGHEAKEESAD